MIVHLANKTRFRADILSNRIEEVVHESMRKERGESVGASELASWKNSLRHMDTVLEDAGIPDNAGVAIEFTFQVLLAVFRLMVVLHAVGMVQRIQPWTENAEIVMYSALAALALLFWPAA